MLRRFLEDTLDLFVDLLAKLGIVRGDTYWMRQRLRRKLLPGGDRAVAGTRSARSRQRICPKC